MFAMIHNKIAAPLRRTGAAATSREEATCTPRRPYRRPEVVALGTLDRLQYGYTGSSDHSHGWTHYT